MLPPEPLAPPRKIRAKLKGAGLVLLEGAAMLAWSYLMTKVSEKLDAAVVQWLVKRKMADLEPEIQARLDHQVPVLAQLQLANPGKPVYGNVSVRISKYREPDDDEEVLIALTIEFTDVTVAIEPRTFQDYERQWGGIKYIAYRPVDVIRQTFPLELEPLSRDALRGVLDQQIAQLEQAEALRSSTPEGLIASQRERDRLSEQRCRVDQW